MLSSSDWIAIASLGLTPIGILFLMWRDIALIKKDIQYLKRDVDGVALFIGTPRALAQAKDKDKLTD